jgi:hypothetical protein
MNEMRKRRRMRNGGDCRGYKGKEGKSRRIELKKEEEYSI